MLRTLRRIINTFYSILNYIQLKINRVKTGKHLDVRGIILLMNSGRCIFGDNVVINSSKYNNIIGGDTRTSMIIRKSGKLTIGDNVRISNSAFYCTQKITIGDGVMIGGSTKIWDTDFHSLNPSERSDNPNEGFRSAPVVIEKNAFIGGSSIILKGVTIGANAIIGAGSVVSKSVPAGEIWAGNPARFVKKIVHE